MLRFVTTADTEILATAAAVERLPDDFPEVRCANPGGHPDPAALIAEVLDGARVVLCRILGGRRGWPEGLDLLVEGCRAQGAVLLALGGEAEPDAEMTALSTAPAGAVAQAGEYLRHGDVDNVEQLLRFLADTFLLEGHGFEAPREVADLGVYMPPGPETSRSTRRWRGSTRPARPSASASTARTALLGTRPSSTSWPARSRTPGPTRSPCGATRCAATPTDACRRWPCSRDTSTR